MTPDLFDRFLQEKTHLHGVDPKTLEYYRCVRHAFEEILTQPTKDKLLLCIEKLLKGGISPVSVNTYLRGFKVYLRWLHEEHGHEIFKVRFLKTEQKVLATFTAADIPAFMDFKPIKASEKQLRALILTLADTGVRINEALCLRRQDVNLEGLTLLVHGKGNKQRLVPMSVELRKSLFRHMNNHEHELLFSTKDGVKP